MRIRTGLLAGLLAVALAGCGAGGDKDAGDGIASAGGPESTAGAPPSEGRGDADPVKFAQCMRDHGIDMPDPDMSEGGFKIKVPDGGGGKEKMDAAMKECNKFMGGGMMGKPPKEFADAMRKNAQCMRENGVPDFPDPDAEGRIMLPGSPDDPAIKSAMKICEKYMPGGSEGPAMPEMKKVEE
ncbi:MAG TPA: hypothetical protein VM677_33385 [Actinokineospora sp.]|nr:hypothetical protein [Actinokineospora sp.]